MRYCCNYLETNLKIKTNCKWITYLSATSVYGDHKGDWVNENSITKPSSPNRVSRLQAENSWISLSNKKNFHYKFLDWRNIFK